MITSPDAAVSLPWSPWSPPPGGAAGNQDDAAADSPPSNVAIALSESAFTLDTPDLAHPITATVTGAATTTVSWSSSNSYIATVTAAGVVTSVSGGSAVITATATADTTKSATCTVTVAEPDRARAASYLDAKTITAGPVRVIMVGDSLMRTYAASATDQAGWGQVLGQFLSSDAAVDNTLSNGGRSSRSFYNEVGRWDQVKARLAAAKTAGVPAFVFIMFAHNDQKKTTDTDGALYLTFARHKQNGTVAGTFYDYLERYIVETRELGGIPVLFTPFVRQYLQGAPATVTAEGQHKLAVPYAGETAARGDYPAVMKEIAAKHDVPLVDITAWSKTMVEEHAASASLPYVYIAADQTRRLAHARRHLRGRRDRGRQQHALGRGVLAGRRLRFADGAGHIAGCGQGYCGGQQFPQPGRERRDRTDLAPARLPYNTGGAVSGKSLMLANVVISGVTN